MFNLIDMTISNRIRDAMKEQGLKQADLARLVDVQRGTVSAWINDGVREISGSNLMRLSSVLNVSPLWLLEGRGPKRAKGLSDHALENTLSPRGLRVAQRLLRAEQDQAVNEKIYTIVESAIELACREPELKMLPAPDTESPDIAEICNRLPEHQREALVAFLKTLV